MSGAGADNVRVAMTTDLEQLAAKALRTAEASESLDDVAKAVSIYKEAAGAQKDLADAATLGSAVRNESLKNWAQILVPFLSVLTLGVTLFSQVQQQRDAQRNKEDAEWRAAILELRTAGKEKTIASLLPQVRLKPFLNSKAYGAEANDLARLLLPRIADPDSFRDLFRSVNWHGLDEMVTVNRSLSRYWSTVANHLKTAHAIADSGGGASGSGHVADRPAPTKSTAPPTPSLNETLDIEGMEREQELCLRQLTFVSRAIAERVRRGTWSAVDADLEGAWFNDCDFSDVDFRGANLTDAGFSAVNLKGAHLNVEKIDNAGFRCNWWDAAEISDPLLATLIANRDPGVLQGEGFAPIPTKEAYMARIQQLCAALKKPCPRESITYTTASAAPTK
jgi:hypothetical protein